MAIMASVPSDDEIMSVQRNDSALFGHLREVYAARWDARVNGEAPGPSLKFLGFTGKRDAKGNMIVQGKVPFLRWGQTTLVTALPGHGKTTFGGIWAEHNAWEKNIDVLYIHMETEQETMAERSVARNIFIPTDYQGAGLLNITDPDDPVTKRFLQFEQLATAPIKKHKILGTKDQFTEKPSGEIIYVFCPGWDVFRINNAIALQRRFSDERGRGLLVIVDYYNLIDCSSFMVKGTNESSALGKVALKLRQCIQRENLKSQRVGGKGVHCIIFAQQGESKGQTYAYGSKQIVQYAQLHIAIRRELANEDKPMGDEFKDALGFPRFWHRRGDWNSHTILEVVKGNDNQKGEVKVRVENKFYRAEDPKSA
jgi:hypothetical protein